VSHLCNRNRDRKVLQAIAIQNRQLGSHRARNPRAPQSGFQRLERVSERVIHRRALEPAVGHAVVAAGVASYAVVVPARVLQQGAVAGRVTFIGEQIAGPLPTEDVIGRIAPRCALICLIAREKIQKQRGMIEGPAGAGGAAATAFEDLAEQALARAAPQENVLPRSMLIAVAGRDRDAFDAELHRRIEECSHFVRIRAAEERAVDGHSKALAARELDCRDCLVEHPLLAHRLIVMFPIAVQMDREREIARRTIFIDMLG